MKKVCVFKSDEGKREILAKYDDLLSRLETKYREVKVSTDFGETYVLEAGVGNHEVVVLLHGSCSNSAMWFGDMPRLALNYHVFSIDILGEAGSSEEVRLDLDGDEYALWLEQVLTRLGVSRMNIIGNSFGGWIAINFASKYNDMVDRLVLIASSGIVPVSVWFLIRCVFFMMLGRQGLVLLNRMVFGRNDLPEEVINVSELIMKNFVPMVERLPVFSDEQMSHLAMPVLFIVGQEDATMDTHKAKERIENSIGDAEVDIIEECGHVVTGVVGRIISFLESE